MGLENVWTKFSLPHGALTFSVKKGYHLKQAKHSKQASTAAASLGMHAQGPPLLGGCSCSLSPCYSLMETARVTDLTEKG